MANQTVFERIEKKYLLTRPQYDALCGVLRGPMQTDEYGRHTICNLYYDTAKYDLIRASLEKPVYKEKLRLRSYGTPGADSTVFVELKKKYKGIVYKRRAAMSLRQAEQYLSTGEYDGERTQILRELDYFLAFYHPVRKVFLAYDRVALYCPADPALRITFDENIRWRSNALALSKGDWGAPLSVQGKILMEIKIPGAMPLWLSRALSELQIYPASFSKYGCCYSEQLSKTVSFQGGITCA